MIALARFEAKFCPEPNSGCWLWTGAAPGKGYGQFSLNDRIVRAHRASWILYRGDIPAGMHVLHKCDTPCCVNPEHLFLGTNAENVADMLRKGRADHRAMIGAAAEIRRARARCLRGHPLSGANLAHRHGSRICLECRRIRCRESRAKRKAAA